MKEREILNFVLIMFTVTFSVVSAIYAWRKLK
jgi:hypothetical protein